MVNDPVAGTVKDSRTVTAPVGDDSSGTTSTAAIRAAEARTAARAAAGADDGRHGDPRYGRRHVVCVTGVTSKIAREMGRVSISRKRERITFL